MKDNIQFKRTHFGWLYFLPVWVQIESPKKVLMRTAYVNVPYAIWLVFQLHRLLCWAHRVPVEFPSVRITKEYVAGDK